MRLSKAEERKKQELFDIMMPEIFLKLMTETTNLGISENTEQDKCQYTYIYISLYTHTHTHTHTPLGISYSNCIKPKTKKKSFKKSEKKDTLSREEQR